MKSDYPFLGQGRFMKTQIQIQADFDSRDLLKSAGVKRIREGAWYTVTYRGIKLDNSTITGAKLNRKGELI